MKLKNPWKKLKGIPPHLKLSNKYSCLESDGFGPFITRAILKTNKGKIIAWNSRDHRKKHFKLDGAYGTTWWAPQAIGWWIGILFAIGASLFALGSFPNYNQLMGDFYDNITFFMGSIFFTSAAFLQYLEAINSPQKLNNSTNKKRIKLWIFAPLRIDWWSVLVQLIGTILFNINTFFAIFPNLTATQANKIVWTPDAFGSLCFLIASALAWIEFNHKLLAWKPRNISWWINGINFLGSVAFGVSAVFAYILPSTNLPKNIVLMNLGTFIGALCFFIGAILLLPERTQKKSDDVYSTDSV